MPVRSRERRPLRGYGFADIQLQHIYRTVGWLADIRDELEKDLFFQERDLFSQALDLVFIDTTSTFVYRTEETALRKRGYSRDRMPDQPQVMICLAVDEHGWPLAWELLPGNTADTVAFVAMIHLGHRRCRAGVQESVESGTSVS